MAAQAEVPFADIVQVYDTAEDVVEAILRTAPAAGVCIAEDRIAAR